MKNNFKAIGLAGIVLAIVLAPFVAGAQNKIVVYQSDFGVKDGAVSEMKGVAMGVSGIKIIRSYA